MSTTTFSGPVKAGNIFNRTGNTLGENVANQGQATMVQVAEVSEVNADPAWTGIVIPANSQITRIAFLVTVAFGAGVPASYVGTEFVPAVTNQDVWFVDAIDIRTIGLHDVTTQIRAGFESHWKDTGANDIHLTFFSGGASGSGKAMLIVEYVQNNNLTA